MTPCKIKKNYGSFLWMRLKCFKATAPLRGESLLFITESLGVSGPHLFDVGRMMAFNYFEIYKKAFY